MKTGIELIAIERQRQIEAEGWTPEHDQQHEQQELARAAATYAMPEGYFRGSYFMGAPRVWPFGRAHWKPSPNDRVKELVKAGALIAAEIDRLQALESAQPPKENKPTAHSLWKKSKDEGLDLKELLKENGVLICTKCRGTGTVHIGGSFGGSVQTMPCDCKLNTPTA